MSINYQTTASTSINTYDFINYPGLVKLMGTTDDNAFIMPIRNIYQQPEDEINPFTYNQWKMMTELPPFYDKKPEKSPFKKDNNDYKGIVSELVSKVNDNQ